MQIFYRLFYHLYICFITYIIIISFVHLKTVYHNKYYFHNKNFNYSLIQNGFISTLRMFNVYF